MQYSPNHPYGQEDLIGWNLYAIWQETRDRIFPFVQERTEVKYVVPTEDGRYAVTTVFYTERWDSSFYHRELLVESLSWEDFKARFAGSKRYAGIFT